MKEERNINYCYSAFLPNRNGLFNVAFAYKECDNSIIYAFAVQSPDDNFNKKRGRNIATTRLLSVLNGKSNVKYGGYIIRGTDGLNLYKIKQVILKDFMYNQDVEKPTFVRGAICLSDEEFVKGD